jgi:hypothetical protein
MSYDIYANVAHVSSVDLNAATTSAAGVGVGSDALNEDGEVIATLDANGLLSYRPDQCGAIALANGSVIKAIRPLYDDGSTQSSTNYEGQGGTARKFRPLLLRAADGGAITIIHDAEAPLDQNDEPLWHATERLACQYAANATLLNAWVYVQWEYVAGARRWRCSDWGAHQGNPANYESPPGTQAVAMSRIESALVTLLNGPIPNGG